MYLDFYGLKEPPFAITPDPRFVFLSDRHRDALAHLLYGVGQGGGGGFVQLTGEVGTGKTTLCRLLLEQLPENARVALVLNPKLSPLELLETICEELHIEIGQRRGSLKALVDALNAYLLEAYAQGLRVVLIIDEAQNLSTEALEQVRLLTNLETATQKLLQIILLGQPELREMLARPELRQLAQRITARYHLTPLDVDETEAYLRHRLAVAGSTRFPFTKLAVRKIHEHANGVPRLINVVTDRALVGGYAQDLAQIGETHRRARRRGGIGFADPALEAAAQHRGVGGGRGDRGPRRVAVAFRAGGRARTGAGRRSRTGQPARKTRRLGAAVRRSGAITRHRRRRQLGGRRRGIVCCRYGCCAPKKPMRAAPRAARCRWHRACIACAAPARCRNCWRCAVR